jgi:hypothetical protein
MRAFDPDPASRFSSAGEMARAIQAAFFGYARLP